MDMSSRSRCEVSRLILNATDLSAQRQELLVTPSGLAKIEMRIVWPREAN